MKRICVASLVEHVTAVLIASALVACDGQIADDHTTGTATPTPSPSTTPTATPTNNVDTTTYDAPQVKAVTSAQCTITAADSAVGDLPLPAGVDGVLEYKGVPTDDGSNDGILQIVVGTPCATATDRAKCHASITALAPPPVPGEGVSGSCGAGLSTDFLVVTSGDTVQKITTVSEVIALYGQVASAAEAALVVQVEQTLTRTCEDMTPAGPDFDFPTDMVEYGDGTIVYTGPPVPPCTGRLTEGCQAPHVAAGIGGWLGAVAALERSAVDAFERMAFELDHHRAPPALIARATKARDDEIRHARAMARQAARFGGRVDAHAPVALTVRDLEAVALENAIEGCVRETFGAVIAAHQARTAADAELRAELAIIAREEAEHAQLSWDVAAWVEPLLGTDARARVDAARDEALARIGDALSADADEQAKVTGLNALAGLPSRTEAETIVAATRAMV